jgi:hypothetical protein
MLIAMQQFLGEKIALPIARTEAIDEFAIGCDRSQRRHVVFAGGGEKLRAAPIMRRAQDDHEVGSFAGEQFAIRVRIGRAAAPRIDVRCDQAAQRCSIAGGLRDLSRDRPAL